MILKRVKVNAGGILGINCYIVQDENTKEAMVIDPGGSSSKIIEMLEAIEAKVKYILLTHCHGDHIGAVNEIREKFGGTVIIHREDYEGLTNPDINLSAHIGLGPVVVNDAYRVDEGDLIHVGELEFKVIHTPGHTIRKHVNIL